MVGAAKARLGLDVWPAIMEDMHRGLRALGKLLRWEYMEHVPMPEKANTNGEHEVLLLDGLDAADADDRTLMMLVAADMLSVVSSTGLSPVTTGQLVWQMFNEKYNPSTH